MNVFLITGVLFVLALLLHGLLVVVYANSYAHNVHRRLRQFTKR